MTTQTLHPSSLAPAPRGLGPLFAPSGVAARTHRLALLGLALLGLLHWAWFFHGPLTLAFEDWPKERVYLEVLRDTVSTQQIPLHIDRSLQMTERFLAIPETMLAPHLLLLPWLDNRQFITLHVCLLFLVGLAGCRQLARHFGWSPFTFIAFTATFSFNGFITARLAVGHFMWTGYYLFPWALWVALRLLDEPRSPRRILELAWLVFGFFLIGSFHLAVWWMLFFGAVALVRPRLVWPVGAGLALGAVLSLFRLAPSAMTYGHVQRDFATGFPDLTTLGRAFVSRLTVDTPLVHAPNAELGWWEFDHYVGWAALAFVLVYLFRRAPGAPQDPGSRRVLLFGAAVLAVFSLFRLYAPIAGLPLPLFNAERITTRFISVAFFVALACACTRFDRDAASFSLVGRILAVLLLGYTLFALARHSAAWRPGLLESTHPPSAYWPDSATMTAHIVAVPREMKYKLVTGAAWACSLGAFLLTLLWWRHTRPASAPAGP